MDPYYSETSSVLSTTFIYFQMKSSHYSSPDSWESPSRPSFLIYDPPFPCEPGDLWVTFELSDSKEPVPVLSYTRPCIPSSKEETTLHLGPDSRILERKKEGCRDLGPVRTILPVTYLFLL